jgi:hypothetical protein
LRMLHREHLHPCGRTWFGPETTRQTNAASIGSISVQCTAGFNVAAAEDRYNDSATLDHLIAACVNVTLR